ncbi:MAG: hypothetical protein ABI688_07630 [Bacteroidota bacterium]
MKLFFAALSMALLLTGCKSKKSSDETNPIIKNDSAGTRTPDSVNHTPLKDTATGETDFGGVGELNLELSQVKVIDQLGQPDSKTKAEEWGADGLMHQDWVYKTKGITLNMSGEKGKEQTIFSITVAKPCTLKTKMNMGIGSTYQEVKAAYEKHIDKSNTDNKTITVGSLYGGIIFTFGNDGKADTIFIGAAAE